MAFPHIKKNDGFHFCVETGFLRSVSSFSYKQQWEKSIIIIIALIGNVHHGCDDKRLVSYLDACIQVD